ncbi:hypothetical protein D3C75_985180 [compost metagenome]
MSIGNSLRTALQVKLLKVIAPFLLLAVLLPARLHLQLAVISRCYSDDPLEHPAKGDGIGVAQLLSDILQIIAGCGQQVFGPLHPQLGQEIREFHIELLFEQMGGIFARNLEPVAQMLE